MIDQVVDARHDTTLVAGHVKVARFFKGARFLMTLAASMWRSTAAGRRLKHHA